MYSIPVLLVWRILQFKYCVCTENNSAAGCCLNGTGNGSIPPVPIPTLQKGSYCIIVFHSSLRLLSQIRLYPGTVRYDILQIPPELKHEFEGGSNEFVFMENPI